MCKFYISASLKRELFISRDRRDDSLLFKVVSKRGVRQFYCPTSNLEIFPREISSLGSKIREFNLSSRKRNRCTRVFFFFIIYVSILTAEIFRGIFYMSEGESVSRIREKVYRRWKIRVFFSLHFCFMHESIGERLGWRVSRRVESRRRLEKRIEKFSRIFRIFRR